MVDQNKDMSLSWDEVYDTDIRSLITEFPNLLPPPPGGYLDEEEGDNQGHDEL